MRDPADVGRVADAGGRLIVMPHADLGIVRAAKALGLLCVPGVATPTEAFGALAAGADALKMFPAEALPPAVVRAWRAVLPKGMAAAGRRHHARGNGPYLAAGANGFGLGSALYRAGLSPRRSPAAPKRSQPPTGISRRPTRRSRAARAVPRIEAFGRVRPHTGSGRFILR